MNVLARIAVRMFTLFASAAFFVAAFAARRSQR